MIQKRSSELSAFEKGIKSTISRSTSRFLCQSSSKAQSSRNLSPCVMMTVFLMRAERRYYRLGKRDDYVLCCNIGILATNLHNIITGNGNWIAAGAIPSYTLSLMQYSCLTEICNGFQSVSNLKLRTFSVKILNISKLQSKLEILFKSFKSLTKFPSMATTQSLGLLGSDPGLGAAMA